MRCDFADSLLHCYFDTELSSVDAAEFGKHVEKCADCGSELVHLNLLRDRLQLAQIYEQAPASLRRKINAQILPKARTTPRSQLRLGHWLAAAALLFFVATILWRMSLEPRNDDYQAELAAEIVDAHLRSLQPGDATGIASSDERAVKGWFDARIKFALSVHDFANQGFALKGGRLELLEGRSVAALVYERNGRLINVFVWPTQGPDKSPRKGSQRGFQWVDWRQDKIEFCAVSDTDPADLEQLRLLIHSNT